MNSSALNRAAFAGIASAFLVVSASASFVAEATVTSAASVKHAAKAQFVVDPVLEAKASLVMSGNWHVQVSSESAFDANKVLGAKGSWESTSTLQAVVLNTIHASANFDAVSQFKAVPNALFAEGHWVASTGFSATALKSGALAGQFEVNSAFVLSEGLVTRGAKAHWEAAARSFRAEPTVTSNGVVYHSGYVNAKASSSLQEDPTKAKIKVGYTPLYATSSIEVKAHGIYQAKGAWENSMKFFGAGTLKVSGQGNWSTNPALVGEATHRKAAESSGWETQTFFNCKSSVEKASKAQWASASAFTAEPTLKSALSGSWVQESEIKIKATRRAQARANWTSTPTFTGEGVRTAHAEGNWDGLGSILTLAGVLRLVPAPKERQLMVAQDTRSFLVLKDARTFQLTKRTQQNEVA